MLLTFIYPYDDIFAAVKQESSLFSIRQTSRDGKPLFETLVLDEAYLPKFREMFLNARAQITPVLAAYKADVDDPGLFERRDFTRERDFVCHLRMPEDFNGNMKRPLEDHIFSFLKDWIMYKWLETKMPEAAATFLGNCEEYRSKITGALNSRSGLIRRRHGYY